MLCDALNEKEFELMLLMLALQFAEPAQWGVHRPRDGRESSKSSQLMLMILGLRFAEFAQ